MSDLRNLPAFPNAGAYGHSGDYLPEAGMTLRDWFAGQALAGLLSDSDNIGRHSRLMQSSPGGDLRTIAAAFAFQYADAMIAQRATGVQP